MRKPDRFYYSSKHKGIKSNVLLASLMVGLFLFLSMRSPINQEKGLQQVSTPASTSSATQVATPSVYPQEVVDNREQTNGIVLAGALLVLIIIGGTVSFIRSKD